MSEEDIPFDIKLALGSTHSRRISALVNAMIAYGQDTGRIGMDAHTADHMSALREFMFEEVYQNPVAKGEEGKSEAIVRYLYHHFAQDANRLPAEYWAIADRDGLPTAVCDYIAGMTDRYAVMVYQDLTIPKSWNKY